MKTENKPPVQQALSMKTTKPAKATEVKRSGSFRPEDISGPSLQSSTNKQRTTGLPLTHGSASGVTPLHQVPYPPTGRATVGAGRPIPTRHAPSRPSQLAHCHTVNTGSCTGDAVKAVNANIKPSRPPPPTVQRSRSTPGAVSPPTRPLNLPTSTQYRPTYENASQCNHQSNSSSTSPQFDDVPLNSPTTPSSSHYVNEVRDQPIRGKQPGAVTSSMKGKARWEDSQESDSPAVTFSKDTNSSNAASRSGPTVNRSHSAAGRKPAVLPKPGGIAVKGTVVGTSRC